MTSEMLKLMKLVHGHIEKTLPTLRVAAAEEQLDNTQRRFANGRKFKAQRLLNEAEQLMRELSGLKHE